MRIILLGAPGAGKGTQAVIISQKIALTHIASGDLFRKAEQKGDELGLLVSSYMKKGLLVPDDITIRLILENLTDSFILDGFPRTLNQAKALDKALAKEGKDIDKVIYIKVSQEELLRRLSGRWICQVCQAPYHIINSPPKVPGKCDGCGGELYQRLDDKVEAVQKRLEVYFAQTLPLIDYYREKGKLVEVDGEKGIEMVTEKLLEVLA